MFGSPRRPQLSCQLFQSCVRDFGGLFYCVPLCDAALARCWEPVRKPLTHRRLCQVFGEVIQAWHKDRCESFVCVSGVCVCTSVRHSGLMSMFVLGRECCFFFLYVRAQGPLKKTDGHRHTRTTWPQVGGNLCLFVRLCYHLLFPVKTGKDSGKNGGLESAALMCVGPRSSSARQ